MTTFLDHKDNEYEAQTVIKATNAVNGERSLTGTIYTNEEVLNKIDKGWKIKFQDEFYRVIFAKPIDTGNKIQVDFDAVHQFFYDFDKSSVHSQLPDGSHTFLTYLDFIFSGSGYTYNLEVTVNALNKQSFGYKSRLDLFNDIVKSSGIEFFVSGKVVRILQKTGTDLSTIVRKNFNMNELGLEKKINDFVTYQKGFGAWFDKDDHSKGRLEVEYTSPLASEYGIIEAEPLVDERYTNADSLLASLKQNVDSSYSISVQIDMEDLTKAGYQYTQPVAGDYIMAINETVGFKEKIRIVSFTSEYDVTGKLISHKVTCNDIGTVKKQSNVVNRLSGQLNSNETKLIEIESTAKEALVSADGKNTNYYGTEMPVDSPKGTLKTGDLLFLTVGDTTKQYYWNGAEWIINPFSDDIDFVKKDINDKISEVNAAIKDGDDALNQKYDEIVAKTISQDTLISQAQSTADSAKTDATTALSNIASESQKLTEQINALSKTEGDHYTATTQTLTQLDGTVKGLQTDYTALVNKDNEITQTLTNYKQTIDQNTASITENKKATDGTISSLQTQVTQNKNDISTKASQLTVDNLSGRMSSAETTITQNANEISTRLSQTNIESLITSKATVITDNKVKETSDSFSREITRVENKADSLTVNVNTVKDTVDSHTQMIGQQGTSLTTTIQKVDSIQTSVSNIDGRLSTVTQTADGLVTTVQNLSAGGNKLLLNADFELLENKTSFTVGGVTYSQGPKYWSTYNGGIPNPGTSFHSYSGSFGGRNNVVIFNESDGSRNWKAINQSIGKTIMPDFPDTINDFMLSFDAYANLSGTKLFGGFYYVNKLTGATNFHAGQFTVNSITAGTWNRYSVKVPFNKDICDFSKTFSFLIYGYGFSSNAILAIDNVQLETGTISSAFGKSRKELDDQISSIQTTVTQTANSWAVKNLTSNGSILGQINLTDGTVKIDGKVVRITGQTVIDNAVIKSSMIESLTADKLTAGTIDANTIRVINLNANSLVGMDANFLTSRIGNAIVDLLQGKIITAQNGAMELNLNNAGLTFNQSAIITFNSSYNAIVRKKGAYTSFLHFNDDSNGGLYTGLGVTSTFDGINSQSSGRFAGIRIFRDAKSDGTVHDAIYDATEIYGDRIVMKDDFSISRGFLFKPEFMTSIVDMNYLVDTVRALARCWIHWNNVGWDVNSSALRQSIINEYNNYMKDL